MQLTFAKKPTRAALLIYPVFKKKPIKDARLRQLFKKLADAKEFSAKEGETFFSYDCARHLAKRVLFLGFGTGKKLAVDSIMSSFGGALKTAQTHQPSHISLILTEELLPFTQAIAESLQLANYNPSESYKTGAAQKKLQNQAVRTIECVGVLDEKSFRASFEKGLRIAETVNDVRDWVNAPPNIANMKFFEEKITAIKKSTGACLTILKNKHLQKLNMGAILGVNRGSPDEARLIILDYMPKGADKKAPPIVFVGKGILFDSGGYNLKPSGHIEDMQLDKAGAASVMAIIKLLPLVGIKERVIAVAPFTENLIGPHAQKPSEIVRTHSGKTVEVTNTDAEGRLVLCDAISYAIATYKPKYVIDVATLTGACMIALGDRYAGLFSNDKELAEKLRTAGDEVDELLWPLPLHKDFAAKMKGEYADLRNSDTGSSRYAGASKGAAFIQAFVGKTKWAHLDIAGPAFTSDPKKYEAKGATGFSVRALLRFLEKL